MATAVPAIIAAKEREVVETFRDAGATTPALARTTADVGIEENVGFRRLRRNEVIRETNPGFYYLDEAVWIAIRRSRRRLLTVMLILAVMIAASVWMFGAVSSK